MSIFVHQDRVSRNSPKFLCHRKSHRQYNQEYLRFCLHAGSIPNHSYNPNPYHNLLGNAPISISDLSPYLGLAWDHPLMELQMANHLLYDHFSYSHQLVEESHKLLSTGGYRYTPLLRSRRLLLHAGRCNISELLPGMEGHSRC